MRDLLSYFIFILAGLGLMRPAEAVTLPLVEDFELTDGGFTTASVNSWKWGPPTSPESPGAAHSGTQVWGTNLTGSYAPDLDAVLVSPVYDLSAAAGKHIVLHWWQFLVTEEGFDFAEVQVSKNSGGTWETVFGPRHGVVNDEWTQHTVLLDPSYATSGFQIRFRLVTDYGVAEGGFFIDDIRISAAAFSAAAPLQDFEADDGGYVESGVNSSWEYGAPLSAPGAAFSGAFAWATRLDGFYNANEDSTLTSPTLDLSAAAGKLIAVTWRQFFETEEGYDFVDLEVSSNNGATWDTAATWSGQISVSGWTRQQAFLPASYATAGFRLRFRLASDDAYQYDGVAIDDIAVLAAADLFPSAGSFAKSAPENHPILFTRANFESVYTDPDGGALTAILIQQLPASGVLKLNGNPVALSDLIPVEALDSLAYEPATGATGSWSFQYRAANFFAPTPPATVTLNILAATPQVVITTHPESQTVNPGSPVTFQVTAVSSLTLSYQWRKNGGDIDNATGASYTIPSAAEDHEATYDVVISNTGGDSATSNTAFLSVNDPVTITSPSQPEVLFVNEGGDISFTVAATGTGRLDYQWFKDGQPLPDETFAALNIVNAREEDEGNYHCVVTNIAGPKATATLNLTVRLLPRIIANPVFAGVRRFLPARFEVVVAGDGPFTYQWFRNGFAIPGATGPVLSIEKPTDANMGSYTVRVSNQWGSVESEPAELQVLFWRDVAGSYQDVLERPDAGDGRSPFPGSLTISIGLYRTASGVLQYEGGVHRFKGRFDASLVYERVFRRSGRPPLRMKLQFDALQQTVSATITEEDPNGVLVSSGLLPKHRYHRRSNPAPQAGRYTVLLNPDESVAGAPEASAYLAGRVLNTGRGRFSGRLPNGKAFTSSGLMHTTERLPFYAGLSRLGQVCGRLEFGATGDSIVVGGSLVWRHLPRPADTFMPDAFVASLAAEGSLYTPPPQIQPVLNLPLGAELFALSIKGPVTDGSLDRWIRISPSSVFRVIPETDVKVQFKLARRTGRVSGSFIDTGTGKRHKMEGVVIQAQQAMGGYFRGVNQPGKFGMIPLIQ